jgi:DNA-binding NarL/FixJ family response regulator
VLRIEARMANVGRGDLSGRRASLPVAARLREVDSNPANGPEVLAASAAELAMVAAPVARVRELARMALAGDEPAHEPGAALTRLVAARVLIVAEDFQIAEDALRHARDASRRHGSMLGAAFASIFLAELMLRRGDLDGAQAAASRAYALAERGWPGGMSWVVASLLGVLFERGQLDAADELLSQADLLAPAHDLSDAYTSNVLLAARGRLRLMQERPSEALQDLRECGRRQLEWGEVNPALIPWRSLAAVAAADLGELEDARGLAFEELELVRRFGAPGAIGIALRTAARVSDGDEGDRLAGAACEVLAGSEARLQHAYALAELAQRRLAQGQREEARALLEPALELTDRCGAAVLEARVRAQLRTAGGRPRRAQRSGPGSLTPSELQVATLAAEGQPNREIANTLFVTQRTVEFHLGHAYRKLGISSRRQLPDALADSAGG